MDMFLTPTAITLAFAVLVQFAAIVWGAATMATRLKEVVRMQRELQAEFRRDINHVYRDLNDVRIRLAVQEALEEKETKRRERESQDLTA